LSNHELRCRQETEKWDTRAIPFQDLRTKVDEAVNLNEIQKRELFSLFLKYKDSFTVRPGKFRNFSCRFDVNCPDPLVGYSRPVPFSVRKAGRAQTEQMKRDGTLEISTFTHLNPFTIVMREGKTPRICLDARKVNKYMTADRARVQPINELLQQFHGASFICGIDLSSAFLQAELAPESRK
jgi:hypothetical protein